MPKGSKNREMSKIQLMLSISHEVQGRCHGHMTRKLPLTFKIQKYRSASLEANISIWFLNQFSSNLDILKDIETLQIIIHVKLE